MAKNGKKKIGRPPGCLLDKRSIQRTILLRIVVTGTEANCYKNIVSESTYRRWKAAHEDEWEERVDRARKQYLNHKTLADPALKSLVIQTLVNKIKNGELTASELIKIHQFLPDIEL